MYKHGPNCLDGPASIHSLWLQANSYETEPSESPVNSDKQNRGPVFRPELVKRVRREIADGTYDTPEKWDIALDRLWRRLNEE